jgi:hypothetical protein
MLSFEFTLNQNDKPESTVDGFLEKGIVDKVTITMAEIQGFKQT